MTNEMTTARFTRREAETATEAFLATGGKMRQQLLDLYEREAHTALGYGSFEEYTRERLGAEWKDDYLRQLRMWARIERDVLPMGNTRLTKHEATQLARLEGEQRKAAYDECLTLHADPAGRANRGGRFLTDLTHIVNRRLKSLAAPAEEPAPPIAHTTAPVIVSEDVPEETTIALTDNQAGALRESLATLTTRERAKPAPITREPAEDGPAWDVWETALQTALTWVENQALDGTGKTRKDVSAHLCAVAAWVTEGR